MQALETPGAQAVLDMADRLAVMFDVMICYAPPTFALLLHHRLQHVLRSLCMCMQALETPSAQAILDMEDRLAVMLAALCHDLDHDGRSNAWHMHTCEKGSAI
jgi:hypothetical protein